MELKVKAYDKVLVISVSGDVELADVVVFSDELPAICKQFSYVVVSFRKAKVTLGLFLEILKVKHKEDLKQKLLFVSGEHTQADFAEVSVALDSFNVTDTIRVAEIFRTSAQMKKANKDMVKLRLSLQNLMRGVLGQEEQKEVVPPDDEQVLRIQIKKTMEKLQYLYRVLGREIEKISQDRKKRGEDSIAEDMKKNLTEVKDQAKATLKQSGVI